MSVRVGEVTLESPVILAPMAGVTNPPFRQLCREFGEAGARAAGVTEVGSGHTTGTVSHAGLYVCEMVTSRALIERVPETLTMIQPDPADPVRSIQLYGVEPKNIAAAVEILVREDWADHIDINFGCPVPKVTRKGGGSALPWKHQLFSDIVTGAVAASERASREAGRTHTIPVTAKFRIGIDDDHTTFRDVAKMSEDAGISALTLHARTTEQHYSGQAQWDYIRELKATSNLPIFGNGDVFEAEDAARMLAHTAADGVCVGRGCQGARGCFSIWSRHRMVRMLVTGHRYVRWRILLCATVNFRWLTLVMNTVQCANCVSTLAGICVGFRLVARCATSLV